MAQFYPGTLTQYPDGINIPVNARYDAQLTALMWAAGMGHAETVRLLLQHGADASLSDDRGKTAAQMAREAGHAKVADMLAPGG